MTLGEKLSKLRKENDYTQEQLAVSKYAAVGDHAYGMIAIVRTVAEGIAYSHIGEITTADIQLVIEWLDANVPAWLGCAKAIFKFVIR